MLNRTAEYAMRALVYLARHPQDWPLTRFQIAQGSQVPPRYLSSILASLVRAGVLRAARGKSGGFRLVRPAQETSLLEVLSPFDQVSVHGCPFGDSHCNDDDPCLARKQWKLVIELQESFLSKTSLYDVAMQKHNTTKVAS